MPNIGSFTYIGIAKIVFENFVQSFVYGRKINVQGGMPRFTSVSVTLRTIIKKSQGMLDPTPSPQGVAG